MSSMHLVGDNAIAFAEAHELCLCCEADTTHGLIEGMTPDEARALPPDQRSHVYVDYETGE